MNDVRINIFYFDGPEGPGWYLAATRTDGSPEAQTIEEIIPRVRLGAQEMERLAQVLDNFAKDKPLNWQQRDGWLQTDTSLRNAVREANEEAREALSHAITALESEYSRLRLLQDRRAEFDQTEES